MIEYIKGEIAESNQAYIVLDNGGIGYMLNVSLNTYNQMQNAQGVVKLYVYESIREDAHVLFGFADKHERKLFEMLISVSGVGPNTARMILSMPIADLEISIASGDASLLKSVKGVGAKMAQRIIVDLKDKINVVDATLSNSSPFSSKVFDDASIALTLLGYNSKDVDKALKKLLSVDPTLTTEKAIKECLKIL